jgi:hypothetical protein
MRIDRLQVEVTLEPDGYRVTGWVWDATLKKMTYWDGYTDLSLEETRQVVDAVVTTYSPGQSFRISCGKIVMEAQLFEI